MPVGFNTPGAATQRGGFWMDSIEFPQGGATAASPFVCKNLGGLPCLEGLHVQDCSAEGTWGNESPHFGYNLPRLWLSWHCVCEAGISKT